MNKTAFSLILFAGAGLMCFDALAQGPVVSRTETTYSKDNEIIMDGYTPLDEIDNSVKTSVRRYGVPQSAQAQQAPVQQPRPNYVMPVNAVVPVQAPVAQRYQMPQGYQGAPAYVAPQAPQVVNAGAHQIQGQVVIPQNAGAVIPAEAYAAKPVPTNMGCAGANCPSKISSIEYKQSPVKVQYPVVRQYPVSVEYPVTVNREVTVRQPVVVEQPVVVQKPVVVNQPVMVQRAPAYIRQQAVRMQQQPSYVQQQQIVVDAPAGQVLPPCTTGNCR
ncbi:MAG: hypothetical protein IJV86_04410 [Clostridia bacterium]|nr:hypothetical protein [Clostridia bacterium]